MMKWRKGKKLDGLETSVLKFRPVKDKYGRYVPYCDFGFHMGYCKVPEICESRNCEHYHKLYIKKKTITPFFRPNAYDDGDLKL